MKALYLTFLLLLVACETTPTKSKHSVENKPTPTIKVGLVDTAICQAELYQKFKGVKIHAPMYFIEPSYQPECKKLPRLKPRIHAHFVLSNFLHALALDLPVEVTPLVVFNRNGVQSLESWKKLDAHLKEAVQKYDLLISASGYPLKQRDSYEELPDTKSWPFTFLSSGQISRRVNKKTKLFPQSFASSNLLLVGSYIPPKSTTQKEMIFDGSLLNQEQILFYAHGGRRSPLRGSSKAVALFSARALNSCAQVLREGHESFRLCLMKKSESFKFFNMPEKQARRLPVLPSL